MVGCACFRWGRRSTQVSIKCELQPFELPSSLPSWPSGTDFATGSIRLGELQLTQVSTFEEVWSAYGSGDKQGAVFFKPVNIPPGYFCLGYYGQRNNKFLEGRVIVAKHNDIIRAADSSGSSGGLGDLTFQALGNSLAKAVLDSYKTDLPPLIRPVTFTLIWSSKEWIGESSGSGYFWLPSPPDGYKAMGYVVTNTEECPSTQEVMCVRSDLTDSCVIDTMILNANGNSPCSIWSLEPVYTGTEAKGVPVGTFYCSDSSTAEVTIPIACLKNKEFNLESMPSLEQLHTLISHYGPTIFFHPDEMYFPSSISWFFNQGAKLYMKGETKPVEIAVDGSNLPVCGTNDGEYWIDLPNDGSAERVKKGDLDSAEVYIHVKPMLGGTFTDLAMWVYYPFNGSCTAKVRFMDISLGKIGEHVSDWEHFTLRINNFNGELKKIYYSQHSDGAWVDPSELEYIQGNKAVVFSAKHGHASYPHAGLVLQGDERLGVGIRNDSARSSYFLDCSKNYQIVSAEYLLKQVLTDAPKEPVWLQYMREWGPKVQYDSRAKLDKILQRLPRKLRSSLQAIFDRFPDELSGEEGPTGPKEKDNWFGDER